MAGDPDNANLWADADVYVAPIGSALPADADTAFAVAWKLVGLLDGDEGFTESRDEDKSDKYAWGGILVKTARRNFKLTKSFTALENNTTTRALIWPGSDPGEIVVPKPIKQLVAFETREGDLVRRLITANYAEIEVSGDITDSEGDVTSYPFLATIYPTGGGVLFTEQLSA